MVREILFCARTMIVWFSPLDIFNYTLSFKWFILSFEEITVLKSTVNSTATVQHTIILIEKVTNCLARSNSIDFLFLSESNANRFRWFIRAVFFSLLFSQTSFSFQLIDCMIEKLLILRRCHIIIIIIIVVGYDVWWLLWCFFLFLVLQNCHWFSVALAVSERHSISFAISIII